MKKIKNKKILFFFGFLLLLGIIGGTFAYLSSQDVFHSAFHAEPYQVVTTEQFQSPDGWMPGDTVQKDVSVTNKSSIDIAVRVSLIESWVSADNESLPLKDSGGIEPVAYLVFGEDVTNWVKIGDYYYYTKALAPEETTTSLLNAVYFNEDAAITTMDCTTVDGVNNCTTTLGDYTGATYTLTVKVETIQYDQYRSGWDYGVTIMPHNSSPRYIYSDAADYIVLWEPLSGSFAYSEDSSSITKGSFVKLAVSNNRVVHPILGFRYNGNEYYFEKGLSHYSENEALLNSIYGLENCLSLGDNYYTCSDPDTHVTLLPDGSVEAFANSFLCHVCINGNYQCYVHFR